MADLTISQPSGAGAGTLNKGFADAWLGVPIVLTAASSQASYLHSIEYTPNGATTPAIVNATGQVAQFTPTTKGTYRVRSATAVNGVPSVAYLVVRVTKDATGANKVPVAPARGESPAEAPEVNGAATLWDANVATLVAGSGSGGDPGLAARANNDAANIPANQAPLGFVRTGTQWVSPASATPSADIASAIGAGRHVQLNGDATYTLETPLQLVSGKEIVCLRGKALMVPAAGFAPSAGLADSDTSYVMKAAATIAASSGTLQLASRRRLQVIRVNFAIAAGAWYLLKSITGQSATAGYAYGANVIGYELVQVKSVASAGGGNYDATLTKPLQQSHGIGTTVALATNVPQDVILSGLKLNFAGTTHAVGILAQSTDRLIIENCDLAGFSRAGIHICDGSTGARVIAKHRGGSNCAVRLQSSSARIRLDSEEGGERYHANGIPRGLITLRHNCSDVEIYESLVSNGCTAISVWGGTGVTVRDTVVRNCDYFRRGQLDTEAVGYGTAPFGAAGLDFGAFSSPTAWGEFGIGHSVKNVRIENCGGDGGGGNYSYVGAYFCDVYGLDIDQLSILNTGAGAGGDAGPTPATLLTGAWFYDCFDAHVGRVFASGVDCAVRFEGNGNSMRVGEVEYYGNDAYTASGACAFMKVGPGAHIVHIDRVVLGTNDGYLTYNGVSAPNPDSMMGITIGALSVMNVDWTWDDCWFARQTASTAAAQGDRMELFGTTVSSVACRGIRDPSTTDEATKVYVVGGHNVAVGGGSVPQTAWALVSAGNRCAVKSSSTPTHGAAMKPGSGRDTIVDSAPGASTTAVAIKPALAGLVQCVRRK